MADDADIASDYTAFNIQNTLDKHPKFDQESRTHCLDCDEEIPWQRQQLGSVQFCVDCQKFYDNKR